ncbi:MAG TPA: hypothetical protein VMH86_14080 [Rhizomicrobium sp.]|nr:hypothetical protein [Rhizomicrobium sp.]
MKVIDASALVAVLLEEPEGPAIAAVISGEILAAPRLLAFEFAKQWRPATI